MAFFKSTEDIQKYLKVNISQKATSIAPFADDAANKYIRPHLGASLFDSLKTWLNAEAPEEGEEIEENAALTALLPYVLNALAKFTFYAATPTLDVQISETGFGVISTSSTVPASKERVAAFRESMLQLAYDCIEELLNFLELNQDDYSEWVSSDAYTQTFKNFINSASAYDKIVKIDNSRLKFIERIPKMDDVEMLKIEPAISKDLADEIREQIKTDEVSETNEVILPLIRRSLVNFTEFEFSNDEKQRLLGEHYLTEVKKILDGSPDSYPLYKASTAYSATRTNYQKFENSADNSIYVM